MTKKFAANRPGWLASAALMGVLLGGLTLGAPTAGRAEASSQHAGFIHALNDLRDARSLLTVTGDKKVMAQQRTAIMLIGKAMWDIHRGAAFDKKDTKSQTSDAASAGSGGNLQRAMTLLLDARKNLSYTESNPKARGWSAAALGHTNASIDTLNQIIKVKGSSS